MSDNLPNVNKETLELLQRRIESDVRANFLKTVTIPIGGGGIVAIVIAVVAWIPTQIQSILNEDFVKRQITVVANEQVEPLVSNRLDSIVGQRMEEIVKSYLESESGQQLVAAEVERVFQEEKGRQLLAFEVEKAFQAGRVSGLVSQAATTYIEGDGQIVIRQAVLDQLRPTVDAAARDVRENSEQLVMRFVGDAVSAVKRVSKGGGSELSELLDDADDIRNTHLPVVLTKNVGLGPYYVKAAIKDWIEAFRHEFPEQFRHVAVFYGRKRGEGRFVALVNAEQFESRLDESDELMGLLKLPEDQITFEQTQQRIRDMFGPQATRRVELDDTVAQVLRNRAIWLEATNPDERIAVVDPANEDRFVGLTNRLTLEESLFAVVK